MSNQANPPPNDVAEPTNATCPLGTKSHRAHDEAILMGFEFRDTASLPAKTLADAIVRLKDENERLKNTAKIAISRLKEHMERFHPKQGKT